MAGAATRKTRRLTARQRAFVQEYLVDRNATQAAIRAGYSARTAKETAYQLLHKTSLLDAVEQAERGHFRAIGINVERLLSHVWNVATYDPRSFYKDLDGRLVPKGPEDLTREQMMAVLDFRTDSHGKVIGFKFADRQKAQDLVAKFFGFDKVNVEARLSADVDRELRIDLSEADPKDLAALVRISAEADARGEGQEHGNQDNARQVDRQI